MKLRSFAGWCLALGCCLGSVSLHASAQQLVAQDAATVADEKDGKSDADERRMRTMEMAFTSNEVRNVQTALLSRGYYNARPNGILDAKTRLALREFQTEQQLNVTGKIDDATLAALEVVPGAPVAPERRNGFFPKLGYGVKDSAVATKDFVVNGTRTVVNTTKSGLVKTRDVTVSGLSRTRRATTGALTRTRDVTIGAGGSTTNSARRVSKKGQNAIQRTSTVLVGRTDADIHLDVRTVLEDEPTTRRFVSSVKQGKVTIQLPPDYQADFSPTISRLRQVGGVTSVFVVYQ